MARQPLLDASKLATTSNAAPHAYPPALHRNPTPHRQVGTISIDMGTEDGTGEASAKAPVRLGYDASSARDWWSNFVFGKTFVERRSVWTMYRCARRWMRGGRVWLVVG